MIRTGMTVRVRPDLVDEYRKTHAQVWPEVESALLELGFRKISIFHAGSLLFMYQEYAGSLPIEEAYASYAANDACRRWEQLMGRFQEGESGSLPGIRWTNMEEIYHLGPPSPHDGAR